MAYGQIAVNVELANGASREFATSPFVSDGYELFSEIPVAQGTGSSGGTEVYLPRRTSDSVTIVALNTGNSYVLVQYEPLNVTASFATSTHAVQNEVLAPGEFCILPNVDHDPDVASGEMFLYSSSGVGAVQLWIAEVTA